jgi:hypothetical protein
LFGQETFIKTILPEEQPNIKHRIETTGRDLMLLKRKALTLTLILTLLISALVGTLLIQNGARAVAPDALQDAIANAIDFFEGSREPFALLWLDVMHRRFGIPNFAYALQRYDQVLVEEPTFEMYVFRRIADYDNPLQAEDLQALSNNLDCLTAPALYCDRLGLPADYPGRLEQAVTSGDYMLTHALLAWIWIQENDCEAPLPDGFIEDMYRANTALINDDSVVEDIELEAAAFLYLAGQGSLVDDAFVERVIAVQNYDGGWLDTRNNLGDSDWHSTILGLLLLLHVEYPADSYPPVLAPTSSESPETPETPFPTILCIASAAALVTVVSLSLLFYFKKRKR